jgi:hypothetical protein
LPTIRRGPGGPRVRLDAAEVMVLGQLVDEVDGVLAGADADAEAARAAATDAPPDPLVAFTGLDVDAGPAVPPDDPVLRRLLPDAYRDDPEAAADFRRFTQSSLRDGKRADATVVRQGLASVAVTGERVLAHDQADAWLRFLTDARLLLAVRLGIENADDADAVAALDADNPAAPLAALYEWLGIFQADLVAAVGRR